jgi:hypothetical protein
MRLFRALVALALFVTASRCAEVSLLKGDPIKGDLVSVSNKEVVLKQGDKEVRVPMAGVLKIELREIGKPPANKTYSQVGLTDGSTLLVSKWSLKKKTVEMTLLAGPTVQLPVRSVANVLNNAQIEDHRREWKTRTFNTRGKEAVVVKKDNIISSLICALGDGDEKGEKITFAITDDDNNTETHTRSLTSLHGIIFKHTLNPNAPPIRGKLFDTISNVVMVSSVKPREGGLIATTPAGVNIDYSYEQIARLDYSTGKLDFLSDLIPFKQDIKHSDFDSGAAKDRWFIYKDSSLLNKPIRLGGTAYPKGLTLLPGVELTYDLKGQYLQFSATVGIDDETQAEGEGTLVIEGDGKEMKSIPIVYRTEKNNKGEAKKPPRPVQMVNLNIKDVQKLKITFKPKDELNGLSLSVSLGNAKINK